MAKLILYTHLEVIHHGAEICLLRDLYLWKDNPDGLGAPGAFARAPMALRRATGS
jgi:hypothetical protein